MGASSIKMYDKFGIILRIKTTTNNVSEFKHPRVVYPRLGEPVVKTAPLQKTIYSLTVLANLLRASNRRYLEFISTFDDQSQGVKHLEKVSQTVKADKRSYKGFNFFSDNDCSLFAVLSRGEYNINGLRNKSLKKFFPDKSGGEISRILKRLNLHGIIRKVRKTYKYYLTRLGKAAIATGLIIRTSVVIPKRAHV